MASPTIPAVSRVFALVGDSNINRHINKTSCRANPSVKSAQILSCGHIGIFTETMEKLRADITVCILACLTNFITRADGPSTVSHRIDPVLQEIRAAILESSSKHPDRLFLISPPMYRSSPTWYREGLPEVLTLFSQMFSDRPQNLHLLPSFATPDFESDGVHLTAYSGLEYILHLFDSSAELFTHLESSLDDVAIKSCESTRLLEDRMVAIEQDHRRLNRVVEDKIAIDSEYSDFLKNEKFEDSFLITGTSRIPSEIVGKAWQERAVRDVQAVLLILMGKEYSIIFVQNATSKIPNSEVKYHVKMSDVRRPRLLCHPQEVRLLFPG